MARYDKYNPISGGFRAPLAGNWTGPLGTPVGVGLDANGRIPAAGGGGATGVLGVVVIDGQVTATGARVNVKNAGDVVDVMTDGEIVDCADLTAGTVYFAGADGALGETDTDTRVGHTVEAQRLVVRAAR